MIHDFHRNSAFSVASFFKHRSEIPALCLTMCSVCLKVRGASERWLFSKTQQCNGQDLLKSYYFFIFFYFWINLQIGEYECLGKEGFANSIQNSFYGNSSPSPAHPCHFCGSDIPTPRELRQPAGRVEQWPAEHNVIKHKFIMGENTESILEWHLMLVQSMSLSCKAIRSTVPR